MEAKGYLTELLRGKEVELLKAVALSRKGVGDKRKGREIVLFKKVALNFQ